MSFNFYYQHYWAFIIQRNWSYYQYHESQNWIVMNGLIHQVIHFYWLSMLLLFTCFMIYGYILSMVLNMFFMGRWLGTNMFWDDAYVKINHMAPWFWQRYHFTHTTTIISCGVFYHFKFEHQQRYCIRTKACFECLVVLIFLQLSFFMHFYVI